MTGFDVVVNFQREISLSSKALLCMQALERTPFNNIATTPATIIYGTPDGAQIIITPMQFRFTVQRPTSIEEIQSLSQYIPSILCHFEEAQCNILVVHCVDTVKSSESALSSTSALCGGIAEKFGANGVGLRLVERSDFDSKIFNEFKFEPFLRDDSLYFFESITNFKYIDGFDIHETISKGYNYFKSKQEIAIRLL